MSAIQRIRRKVSNNQFIISSHVRDKLRSLQLNVEDIKIVVKYGEYIRTLTDDPRGARYVIVGKATDDIDLELVCRFEENGKVLFITCYDLY